MENPTEEEIAMALILLRQAIVQRKQATPSAAAAMQWEDFHPAWQERALMSLRWHPAKAKAAS